MKRRWVKLAVVVVGMMGVGAARAGLLMLADGRTMEGTVTLVAGVGGGDGKVMVQPAGKAAVSANLADVRKAVFGPRGSTSSKECDGVRWVKTQLGSGSRAGRAEINGNKVTIYDASEGFRIARGNRRDPAAMRPYACCFVFQQLQGDGTIMAKVLPSVEGPKTTRAGVMICEGVEGSGPFVFVSRTPDQAGGAMLWRTRGEAIFSTEETGKEGRAVPMPTSGPAGLPKAWVKLVRKATATRNEMEIEAFESANGVTWAKIGEIRRLPVDEKAGIYIGVAATGNLREGAMASFEGIQMTGKRSEPEIVGVQDVYLPDVHTLLADGTVLPVVVESMKALGEAKVKWPENLGGSGGTLVIPGGELVRTQFGALTRQQVERLLRAGGGGGGGGVLTRDGDFLDGEIKQVNASATTVSSVAFGLAAIERERIAAVAYAHPSAPSSPSSGKASGLFEVRLQDGTLVVARKLVVDKDVLVMETPVLGTLKAAVKEVVGVERRGL